MIGIVVPTLNNFEGLAKLIASISETVPYHIFVIPNWEGNRGVAASWNEGAKKAISVGCTEIAFINDDVTLSPLTLQLMSFCLSEHPYAAVVTGTDSRKVKPGDQDICFNPDYACFMMTAGSYSFIGEFDENFTPAYFEDNDHHYRVKLAGKDALRLNRLVFEHEGSATQFKDKKYPVVPSLMFENNRDYYVKKWGGVPGRERYTSPYGDNSKNWKYWNERLNE